MGGGFYVANPFLATRSSPSSLWEPNSAAGLPPGHACVDVDSVRGFGSLRLPARRGGRNSHALTGCPKYAHILLPMGDALRSPALAQEDVPLVPQIAISLRLFVVRSVRRFGPTPVASPTCAWIAVDSTAPAMSSDLNLSIEKAKNLSESIAYIQTSVTTPS
jgi:hypothetical protein